MNSNTLNEQNLEVKSTDWKDESSYAYLNGATHAQFAWEFLRRNKEYIKDYKKYKKYPNNNALESNKDDKEIFYKYFESNPPCKKGESFSKWLNRAITGGKCQYNSKLYVFLDKYDLDDDIANLNPNLKKNPKFNTYFDQYPVMYKNSKLLLNELKCHNNEVFDDEVYFKISLLLPIEKQLKDVKEKFNAIQKKSHNLADEIGDKALITYLRLLDADDKEANSDEILLYIYEKYFNLADIKDMRNSGKLDNLNTLPFDPLLKGKAIKSLDELKKIKKVQPDVLNTIQKKIRDNRKKAQNLMSQQYINRIKSISFYYIKNNS